MHAIIYAGELVLALLGALSVALLLSVLFNIIANLGFPEAKHGLAEHVCQRCIDLRAYKRSRPDLYGKN